MCSLTTLRRWRFSTMGLALLVALVLGIPWAGPGGASAEVYEGFGATTTGGPSDTVVRVTTLANAGRGSLREALSGGNRTIVFDVGGDIVLTEYRGPSGQTLSGALTVTGGNITIDGFTAPSPGITIVGRALVLLGDRGAHNIIARGLRFRDARRAAGGDSDNIQVGGSASNIVFSHISTRGATDGNLDIAGDPSIPGSGPRNVTVAWSIIGEPASHKAMLIKFGTCCVTLHHNLFMNSPSRNPSASIDDLGTPATQTTLDMRNNVVWDWGTGYGTLIHGGARANVVRNYFASPDSSIIDKRAALWVCAGHPDCLAGKPAEFARAFIQGNVQGDGLTAAINRQSTQTGPFSAPPVATTDACTAARAVLAGAGPPYLDAVEQAGIAAIPLTGCPAGKAPSTVTLKSSANPSLDRGKVTFTGTVVPVEPSAFTPSGTITFLDGGVVVAKAVRLSGGKAEFSIDKLKLGPHPITAMYSGDTRFAASESQTVVQTVFSVPGGSAKASAINVDADLEPCCGAGSSEVAADMVRKSQVKDNVLQTDNVVINASFPMPAAGITNGTTARAATVRMVFTRDAERYAECFLELVVLVRHNNIPIEAQYQAKIDMKLGQDGKPVITQRHGRCDVDIASAQVQPGVPAALIGDVVTVTVGFEDTMASVLEGEVRQR